MSQESQFHRSYFFNGPKRLPSTYKQRFLTIPIVELWRFLFSVFEVDFDPKMKMASSNEVGLLAVVAAVSGSVVLVAMQAHKRLVSEFLKKFEIELGEYFLLLLLFNELGFEFGMSFLV